MLDETAMQLVRGQIDNELQARSSKVGIKFGGEIFDEFKARGWIALAEGSIMGTGVFPVPQYAYRDIHPAHYDGEMGGMDWEVGSDPI